MARFTVEKNKQKKGPKYWVNKNGRHVSYAGTKNEAQFKAGYLRRQHTIRAGK